MVKKIVTCKESIVNYFNGIIPEKYFKKCVNSYFVVKFKVRISVSIF